MKYAGEILASEAFTLLKSTDNSILVDVRTQAEWAFSGVPDLASINKNVLKNSWRLYPQMNLNENFLLQISTQVPDKNSKVFFICKTGGRSLDAAIFCTENGYKNCFNITHGFEGDMNEFSQRGKVNGWKASNLPWFQA